MSEQNNKPQQAQEQDLNQLLKVRREKLAALQEAGKDPFQITKYDVTHHSTDIKENFEQLQGSTVRIAGRMMSRRIMGKASFSHISDRSGLIQVYVTRQDIGEENYASYKKDYDIGDIFGFKGFVFKTQTVFADDRAVMDDRRGIQTSAFAQPHTDKLTQIGKIDKST